MDRLLKMLEQEPSEIAMIEPSEETNNSIWHQGVIIIGHANVGMAVAMNHIIHTCAPVLIVQDIGEVGTISHTLLNSEETSHPKVDDGFFQHLIEKTTHKITALKEEYYEAMTCEFPEPRNQHIKNYSQPKVGRLNTNPKPIWWHRSHQRK